MNAIASNALNIPLLRLLIELPGEFVPIRQLQERSSEPLEDLAKLIQFGYPIELHPFPYYGARLLGPAPRLCPDQIEHNLNTQWIGRRIAVWDRTASTNDLAAQAAKSQSNHGLVVIAEEQTAGRGRRGRSWLAPRGSSILMSVLIFPNEQSSHAAALSAMAATAVAETAQTWSGVEPIIKWPNDVLLLNRKVAGILVERGPDKGVVIGIGLNVFSPPEGFGPELALTAISLNEAKNQKFPSPHQLWLDRSDIVRDLIIKLDQCYSRIRTLGPAPVLLDWQQRLAKDAPHASIPPNDFIAQVLALDARQPFD